MTESKQIMDGCTAAAYAAYAFSDLATIYPITPIASMGETADKWALQGRTNIWGRPMEVKEMESELGAAMKYAADGKRTYKKDLGRMIMTYGTVYVASIALGANYMQAIRAIAEAEAYPGPSIVICYCPCINHGIRKGMGYGIFEERDAVRAGYWQLYRYDPRLAAQGKNPLQLDSAAPDGQLVPYINGENRYADLRMIDPREAAILQPQLARRVDWLYSQLSR